MIRPVALLALLLAVTDPVGAAVCPVNVGAAPVRCPVPKRRKPHVRITRDDFGVPHLKANTLYDVGYGTGVAQAQDRLFQMEFVRKSATGHLAEIAGRDFLGAD